MKDLLLLHGAIGSKAQLEPLADALQKDFNVHAIDFAGHGGKALPDFFSIESFADDVLRYMAEQALEQADFFGYSMGGYVALWLARHHPERVGKIFTLATKFEWTPEIASRETSMLVADKIEEKIPAFAKHLAARHFPADWKQVLEKTSDMMRQMGEKKPLSDEDFNVINAEILLSVGDRDTMVSAEETISVYRALPNASMLVIPETPHPIERAPTERLLYEIRRFFK